MQGNSGGQRRMGGEVVMSILPSRRAIVLATAELLCLVTAGCPAIPRVAPENAWVFDGEPACQGYAVNRRRMGASSSSGVRTRKERGIQACTRSIWMRTVAWFGRKRSARARAATPFERCADGGFVLVGAAGLDGMYAVRTDENGDTDWESRFDAGQSAVAHAVAQAADGGFFVAGETHTTESEVTSPLDVCVVKTDSEGQLAWAGTHGEEKWEEWTVNVLAASDGGCVLTTGRSREEHEHALFPDTRLLRMDGEGNLVWEAVFCNCDPDRTYLREEADGGLTFVYVCRGGLLCPCRSVWRVRMDAAGEVLSEERMARLNFGVELINGTNDGGFVVVGKAPPDPSNWGNLDIAVARLDPEGEVLWTRYMGRPDKIEEIRAVTQAEDGSFVVLGSVREIYLLGAWGDIYMYVARVDTDGNPL